MTHGFLRFQDLTKTTPNLRFWKLLKFLKSFFRKYNNNLDVLRLYNANMWVDYQLTKEEFNLLKEVLE